MGLGGGWRWAPVGTKVYSPDLWLYFLQLGHGFHHPPTRAAQQQWQQGLSRSSRFVTCHPLWCLSIYSLSVGAMGWRVVRAASGGRLSEDSHGGAAATDWEGGRSLRRAPGHPLAAGGCTTSPELGKLWKFTSKNTFSAGDLSRWYHASWAI